MTLKDQGEKNITTFVCDNISFTYFLSLIKVYKKSTYQVLLRLIIEAHIVLGMMAAIGIMQKGLFKIMHYQKA